MANRLSLLTTAICGCLVSFLTISSSAQPAPAASAAERLDSLVQVPNSPFQFLARINASAVNVRSGPGENFYPVLKLDRGAQVTVVGIKGDWLKIVPPEGAYSVIGRDFVERDASGKIGTVKGENVRVRAGSHLNARRDSVQCLLPRGTQVAIVGEEEGFLQIQPPPGAALYVHQKFADVLKQVDASAQAGSPTTQPITFGSGPENIGAPTTQPSGTEGAVVKLDPESKYPLRGPEKTEAEFDRLEASLKEALDMKLDKQPVEQLLASYKELVKSEHLSPTMRRIAEFRIEGLKVKKDAKQELLALKSKESQTQEKLREYSVQREALTQKISASEIYTAVGKLQASTLQVGQGALYRLVDPETGRTICYVRNSDPKYVEFQEKFVGVKGELVSDAAIPTLKVVLSTDIVAVDPARVNKDLTAQLAPPSLLKYAPSEKAVEGEAKADGN